MSVTSAEAARDQVMPESNLDPHYVEGKLQEEGPVTSTDNPKTPFRIPKFSRKRSRSSSREGSVSDQVDLDGLESSDFSRSEAGSSSESDSDCVSVPDTKLRKREIAKLLGESL